MSVTNRSLADLCLNDVRSIDPKRNPEKEFWYVDISAVDNVTKRISTPQKTSGKSASVRARQLIESGDVLVATTRPNLNAVAIVPDEYAGQVCSTGFCVLRAGPELDPGYLFAFVQSRAFVDPLVDLTKGALYPAVTDRQVLAQSIPWVAVPQQQRIAANLANQLAAVEDARQAATESHSLGDVLLEVKQGIGSRWADFPVLGATRDGLAPAKEPVGKNPERYKPVTVGTVFYNPMRILIGSIAMVDEGDAPGITSPDYVALRGREGLVDSRWFYYWLRSPDGERCIASLARGAVRERMLFNRLTEGEIALPPYPVQRAASRALAELRPMKAAVEARLREIERLPQRLLAQVFDFDEEAEDA